MKKEKSLYTLALVALLTISAYLLADTVDAMIGRSLNANATPGAVLPLDRDRPAMQRRDLSAYSSILERGLFGDGKAPSVGSAAAEVPTVSYKLIGTVEGGSFAGAVLEDNSGQAFYRINQKLPDGSTMVKIMRDKVTIRRSDGATVNLEVVDDTKIVAVKQQPAGANGGVGVKKLSDGKFMVDQQEVLASTENMSQILTQARALPFIEQGKTVGFKLSEIIPGSIYEKIGLQNGDVIQRVNSQDVDDPSKFFQLYQGLKNERSIAIDLIRGGQHQTLNYDIR
jgi:general secretion pathway protein C